MAKRVAQFMHDVGMHSYFCCEVIAVLRESGEVGCKENTASSDEEMKFPLTSLTTTLKIMICFFVLQPSQISIAVHSSIQIVHSYL